MPFAFAMASINFLISCRAGGGNFCTNERIRPQQNPLHERRSFMILVPCVTFRKYHFCEVLTSIKAINPAFIALGSPDRGIAGCLWQAVAGAWGLHIVSYAVPDRRRRVV
jgi:hypothetical protein